MSRRPDNPGTRLDDAARAGWLYYVAGNTQEEIAAKLGISRQSAQRLVSRAVSEGLIKVRLHHPIAQCLDLADRLRARFALDFVEIVPSVWPGVKCSVSVVSPSVRRWPSVATTSRFGLRQLPPVRDSRSQSASEITTLALKRSWRNAAPPT